MQVLGIQLQTTNDSRKPRIDQSAISIGGHVGPLFGDEKTVIRSQHKP